MNIKDYIKSEKEDLDNFIVWWTNMHVLHPEQYPMDLNEGDWWEQFMFFSDLSPENRIVK